MLIKLNDAGQRLFENWKNRKIEKLYTSDFSQTLD